MLKLRKEILLKGKLSFYTLVNADTGRSQILDYFKELKQQNREEFLKISRRIEYAVEQGTFPCKSEIFKKVEGTNDIYVIKSHQVRLYGFFHKGKGHFILVRGMTKKTAKADPTIIKITELIRDEFIKEQNEK